MNWSPDKPNPCVPERLQGICKLYASAPLSVTCKAGCSYCFQAGNHGNFRKARWWTKEQAWAGFAAWAEKYGPAFLLLGGLEPLDDLELVAGILRHHYASCCTNLLVDPERLYAFIPPDRLDLHPTFHPHLWAEDIDVFLAKVSALRDRGYQVPLVASVGDPRYLPHWDAWRAKIEALGIMPNFVPLREGTYEGRALPRDYTAAEREILNRHVSPDYWDAGGNLRPLSIQACAAGVAYLTIMTNGDVARCGQLPGSLGDQNLFRDGTLTLLQEPLPCNQAKCICTNLWPFHVTE